MRNIAVFLLALGLVSAVPAFASEGNNQPSASASKAAPAAATKAAADKSAAAMPSGAAIVSELTRMQQMIAEQSKELEAQRQQIQALRQQIEASGTTNASATPSAAVPVPAKNAPLAEAESPAMPVTTESASNAPIHAMPAKTIVASEPAAKAKSAPADPQLPSAIELAGGTIRMGFTVYGDWGWYANTSYGPQFFTQINQPGPGNNNFNSFDINRAYFNFFYTPRSGKYTLRLTPNIYRNIGGESAVPFGSNAQVSPTANGSLNLRLKYAYLQFNHPFASSSAFGLDKITLGQTTNPLVDWQEAFYGYRFTSLTPWNYLSLSSTHMGVKIGGPIMTHGKMYLDYMAGVFDSGSFHNQEVASEKQVMARVSVYPLGGKPRFGGFDLSAFVDFGYANKAPDQQSSSGSLYRTAFWAGYSAPHFALLGEYDYGKNAFSTGNMFSGSAPIASNPTYGYLASEASGILTSNSQQRGFDFFGHVDIPHSPFSLFGLYQYFQPNINISKDPLDFARVVGGIAYKYDSHLEFAIDSQNLLFTHGQFNYNGIPNPVPGDINALFVNAQVNY